MILLFINLIEALVLIQREYYNIKVSKPGKTSKVNQEYFHHDFKLPEHNGTGGWKVTLLDRADNRKEFDREQLRRYGGF